MDSQVQELLAEERKVNSQVKQALQDKREKLATIQAFTDRAVAQERRDLQEELNQKIAQVSDSPACHSVSPTWQRAQQSSKLVSPNRLLTILSLRVEKSTDGARDGPPRQQQQHGRDRG